MQNDELINLIKLLSVPLISSTRLRNLLKHFNNPSEVFQSTQKQLKEIPGIDVKIVNNIFLSDNDGFARSQVEKAEKDNIKIITFWDEDYPEYLKNIIYPPSILFCKGDTGLLKYKSIGVVGTRNPSKYGIDSAKYITSKLCEGSLVIVSGMAYGIDTAAHTTALESSGKTIAVLGSGVDIIYPKENKKLYEEICEKGLVISEYYLGTEPSIKNFPARNRIISGLSMGIVLVESDSSGGGMITARFALDQDREVFAVPGNINSRKSRGTNKLIKENKARLVQSADDILFEFNLKSESSDKKPAADISSLTLIENKIYTLLSSGSKHIDDIIEESGLTISEILVTLTNLELVGIIRQLPGKLFEIVE